MIDTLVRAQPLPDEWVRGYVGRVASLNGWSSKSGMADALIGVKGKARAGGREVTMVQLMASVAAMDLNLFLRDHSLFGLWRSVARRQPGSMLGQDKKTGILWALGMRSSRNQGYLCPVCVQEDVDFHGQSYWRREHQLPGRVSCPRHKVPLRCVDLEKVGQISPSACIQTGCSWESEQCLEAEKEVLLERYLDVCSHLMNSGVSRDERHVSQIARKHAHAQGFHTGKGVPKSLLMSDQIALAFDNRFLDEVFPGLRQKARGTRWNPIDDAFRGVASGRSFSVFAAIFSVLMKSADDAALAIIKSKPPETLRKPTKQEMLIADDEVLKQLYAQKKGSHRKVAKTLGHQTDATRSSLIRLGLPSVGRTDPARLLQFIKKLFEEGTELSLLCKESQISQAHARRFLKVALGPLSAQLLKMTCDENSVSNNSSCLKKSASAVCA
jgi:hypothetical protein